MKRILCLIFTILLLVGCSATQEETIPSTTQAVPETTAPAQTEPTTVPPATEKPTEAPTEEPTEETQVTDPVEPQLSDAFDPETAMALTEQQLSWYQQLFAFQYDSFAYHDVNYYNVVLALKFDSPENVDLRQLFNNGFADDRLLTAEEKQWLNEQGANTAYTWYGLTPERMDAVLEQYFGLSMEETNGVGMDQLYYNEEWDRYFVCAAGYVSSDYLTISEGYVDANHVVQLTFETMYMGTVQLTMQTNSVRGTYGYRFLSNVRN